MATLIEEPLFQVVKCSPKGEHPPEYLRNVGLSEIYAYYFNWHTDETHASPEQIAKWYLEARGWCWQPT